MTLDLDPREVDVILNTLAAQPYRLVYALIAKIQEQAKEKPKTDE